MRAETWLAPNVVAIASRIKTLVPGDNLASMMIRSLVALLVFPLAALACDYPDEGNMPLHRAVTKVKLLPETEAWATALHRTGEVVQYALSLDREWHRSGRCYWTVEARAEGSTLAPDDVPRAVSLMRKAQIDASTIAIVVKKMQAADGKH